MKKLLIFGLLLVLGASLCAMEDSLPNDLRFFDLGKQDFLDFQQNRFIKEYSPVPDEESDLGNNSSDGSLIQEEFLDASSDFKDEALVSNPEKQVNTKGENPIDGSSEGSNSDHDSGNTNLPQNNKNLDSPSSAQPSFFTLHRNKLLMCGVTGAAVLIVGDSYGMYRYVKRAHMRGQQTVFDRWFIKSKTGLQKLFRRTAQIA